MTATFFDLPISVQSAIMTQVAYRALDTGFSQGNSQATFELWMRPILPAGAELPKICWNTADDIDHSIYQYLTNGGRS